jgi:NADP-dependent 3-hydroxy acid dehydrogenase YdfG
MGRAVAVDLARGGVVCALIGRRQESLSETAKACAEAGTEAIPVVCDIAQTATIEGALRQAIEVLGGLNYLINCAGVYERSKADEGDLSTWDRILDINLRATYHLARHALPVINQSPGGAVIKVGSLTSSYSGGGAFQTTTRGLDGYSGALFEDVREYGTKVCTIHPGFVRLDRALMIQPEDIARTVRFVLTMPETACPTEIIIRPQRSPYLKT